MVRGEALDQNEKTRLRVGIASMPLSTESDVETARGSWAALRKLGGQ